MNLAALLDALPPTGIVDLPFPGHLLGAFRRKSITLCSGLTDEATIVYWFQSKTFTIDLRLPDGARTPVAERQGWVGETLWDAARDALSWRVSHSYQPRNQWAEPAHLAFIGNSVIEFAPSGAYVEDWRQQAVTGPLLGLRLVSVRDRETGERAAIEGGLVVAGTHVAYAQSRRPAVDDALRGAPDLEQALAAGVVTAQEVESYEVSVALDGSVVTHSTQPHRVGQTIAAGDFSIEEDGTVVMTHATSELRFELDVYLPQFVFGHRTPASTEALEWMQREDAHLTRNAVICR